MNEANLNELCKAGMTRGEAIEKLQKDSISELHKHPAIFADIVTAAMAYMRLYAKHGDGFGDAAAHTYEHCCALLGSYTVEITPEMVEAGYIAYLTERRRLEDGDDRDRRIAFTSIFRAMWQALLTG